MNYIGRKYILTTYLSLQAAVNILQNFIYLCLRVLNKIQNKNNNLFTNSTYRGRKDATISRRPLYVVDLVRRQKIRPDLTAQ